MKTTLTFILALLIITVYSQDTLQSTNRNLSYGIQVSPLKYFVNLNSRHSVGAYLGNETIRTSFEFAYGRSEIGNGIEVLGEFFGDVNNTESYSKEYVVREMAFDIAMRASQNILFGVEYSWLKVDKQLGYSVIYPRGDEVLYFSSADFSRTRKMTYMKMIVECFPASRLGLNLELGIGLGRGYDKYYNL